MFLDGVEVEKVLPFLVSPLTTTLMLQCWTYFLGHAALLHARLRRDTLTASDYLIYYRQRTFEHYSSPLLHHFDGSANF